MLDAKRALLEHVVALLRTRLNVTPTELESLLGAVRSTLHLSLGSSCANPLVASPNLRITNIAIAAARYHAILLQAFQTQKLVSLTISGCLPAGPRIIGVNMLP